MKYIFILIFSMITTISLALGFVDPDAQKTDPEWSRAVRKGAMAKLELHVVEEDGKPVANANIKVIMGMIATAYTIYGQTDTNGVFIIKGKTKGNEIIILSKKEGYYNSKQKLCFIKMGEERQVKNGKWQPYGEKVTVVLRKKKNPVFLIANHWDTKDYKYTKTFYEWIGFDIKENDFVEPYGKGKIADFDVMIEWNGKTGRGVYMGMGVNIRFTEPYSGYYVVDKTLYSDLKSPYEAIPENIKLTTALCYSKKQENGDWIKSEYNKNTCWVVRSRPVVDKNGKLISANYSLIYEISYTTTDENKAGFCVYRAFNPTPNDTNLEPSEIPTTNDGIRIRSYPDTNLPIPLKQTPSPVEND